MSTQDWSQTFDKVSDEAAEQLRNAGVHLKDWAGQIGSRLPEVVYPSVDEAEAANLQRTEANLAYYRERPEEVSHRLRELDEEWDTARLIEVVGSGLMLTGFWFSLTRSRIWLMVPLGIAVLALQHGLTGESFAVAWARRLGFRTRDEIETERRGLLDIRGGDDENGI